MSPLGGSNSGEETVLASGVHVVFTQPVSPSGVPAQYVEHILGEVFVDSLATIAPPLPDLGLGLAGPGGTSSSTCGGTHHVKGGTKSGGGTSLTGGGGSAAGATGAAAGTAGAAGASSLGSASQPTSGVLGASSSGTGSGGTSFPASVVKALKKPLWLLLAYVVWQALVIGTGASIWRWRKGDAS